MGRGSVPYSAYEVSGEPFAESMERSTEEFAVDVASSFLASVGHRAVIAFGGPGRVDLLSLDRNGRVVRTEVKGSEMGTPLDRSGMLRRVQVEGSSVGPGKPGNGTELMFELSPPWLSRTAPNTLRDIQATAASVQEPLLRAHYRELAAAYEEDFRRGFPLGGSQVIQVGHGEELPYLENSPMLDSFSATVQPDAYIQIDVQ